MQHQLRLAEQYAGKHEGLGLHAGDTARIEDLYIKIETEKDRLTHIANR